MPLDAIEIDTAPNPTAAVVVLHGLGADGNDFVPFTRELDLTAVGGVRFVFPHAPTRPVTINGGYVMRAWYDLLGVDLVRREDEAGLRASLVEVDAILNALKARGIPASRIVLAGFSQGCAMALLTGLRHAEPLAGIAGLSGYLPLAATLAAERSGASHGVPVFLAHGRQDPIVPYARGAASRDALAALGHSVEWHEYAMGHSVCMEEIDDLARWLNKVLAPTVVADA